MRRAVATVLFGAVAIMAFKAMLTRGLAPEQYLTAALVFATAVSGWFVVETVAEMRLAREAAYLPVLVPYVRILDHDKHVGQWGVKNVGLGPAIEVKVTMSYGKEYGSYSFTLETTVLGPGEERPVRLVSGPDGDKKYYADLWKGRIFSLVGTCRDIRKVPHRVDVNVSANEVWTPAVNRDNPVDAHGNPLPPIEDADSEEDAGDWG